MLVAMMHLREPVGAGSKMRVCISDGSEEYTGRMCRSGTRGQGPLNRRQAHRVKLGRCKLKLKAKLDSSRLVIKLQKLKPGTFDTHRLNWFQLAPAPLSDAI